MNPRAYDLPPYCAKSDQAVWGPVRYSFQCVERRLRRPGGSYINPRSLRAEGGNWNFRITHFILEITTLKF